MILPALKEYYDRLDSDPDSTVAPLGFEHKEIRFIIVLNPDGDLAGIEDTRETVGKKKTTRTFLVPKGPKRAVNIASNLLWDNAGYVLGAAGKSDNQERVDQCHQQFIETIRNLPEDARTDPGVVAVLSFLESGRSAGEKHPLWNELISAGANISFRLNGEQMLVCQKPAVKRAVQEADVGGGPTGRCLITGKWSELSRLHSAIRGVWGAQPSGANIVSFNLPAFCSQEKTQSFNAPVSRQAEFAYTTALNRLLAKDSRQRIQVGDASTVYWAEKANPLENLFGEFFGLPADTDNAGQDALIIKALYESPGKGAPPLIEDPTRFYVLGLAPNNSRLAVRFWHQGTVGRVAARIERHFQDLRLTYSPRQRVDLSLYALLRAVAVQGKSDNIPPNLGGELMRAILEGIPYPQTLYTGALRRIRAERIVNHARAAIIKAVLVRKHRFYHQPGKEIGVSLDLDNKNTGYLLGRLFAALERAQEAANPGLNSTIRDRFYGAASSTPVLVFPNLLKLKNHHISKLANRGLAVNLEKLLGQIMDGLTDFPAQLDLSDQGRFSVGYYHQRQDFFNTRDQEKKSVEQAETESNQTKGQ